MSERGIPSVVVASAKGGRIVWEEAFGLANRERRIPATTTTMYSLASISKPFTATGLMVLVQRGAVKLDAPANDYLGAAKLRAFEGRASDATVRRVANHTSGLPTHYQFFYADEPYRRPTMDETIARYGILVSPPGTRANYSNLGFGIIDYIIERTSHTPYPQFMRGEVFAPLALSRTAVVVRPISGDSVAERYDQRGAPIPWYDFDHHGASAVYSSAHDLIRFAMFHLKDHLADQKAILPDTTLDAMHRATARHSELVGYGVGWRTHYEDFGYTGIGHTGGMPGVATLMRIYPEEDAAVVVLTNAADNAAVGQITRAVMSALLPRYADKAKAFAVPASPVPVPLPSEIHGDWQGEVKTWQGTVPLRLSVRSDNAVYVRLGSEAEVALSDAAWRDTLLTGTFTGTLPAEDVRRHPYRLRLAVARRGERLTGAMMAEGSPGEGARQYYSLSSWVWLARPNAGTSPTNRPPTNRPESGSDLVFEATVPQLQAAMAAGRTTSVALVDGYLARIAAYDHDGPALNAMIRLNPLARAQAAVLDAERKAGRVRGPLHGIPVIVKDNYSTSDMPTSAASVALATLRTPNDAFQVKRLRDAGAVILGKSNMHELAAGITSISSLGGQTCNPYDPDRNPGGSSGGSGAAVAASFAAIAWGSDTCGSIRIPSSVHNLFGLRPTKGLTSTSGIVPLSHTQDVAGPLARTVMDLAIALDATVGPDAADSATRLVQGKSLPSFVAALDSTSLRGKRFAVLTSYFGEEADDQEGARVVRSAIEKMKARGAVFVEVAIPGLDSIANRASVIDYEFKFDLIDFLAGIPGQHVSSLADILRLGMYDVALESPFRRRDSLGTRDNTAYREALARRLVVRNMVVAFLDSNRYDALVYPTMRRKAALIGEPPRGSTCTLSAVTGLPALSMPAGFTPDGLPIGIELLGRPLDDGKLVALAYDYEQSTHPRRPPSTTPPLVAGRAPVPLAFATTVRRGSASTHGEFAFDATRRTLTFDVRISGGRSDAVYAISIARDSAGNAGPVIRRLAAQGITRTKGSVILGDVERRDLLAGRLVLAVFTSDRTGAVTRAAGVLSPREGVDADR